MKNIFILFLTLSILIPNIATSKKVWKRKHYVKYEDAAAMFSLDSNTAVAFTRLVGTTNVYKTTDAGDTWDIIYEHDASELNDSVINPALSCYCLDSNYLYFSYLERAVLDKSTDGGKTFERVTFGEVSAIEYMHFRGISMYNRNIGALVSYYHIFSTTDNWETSKVFKYNYVDTSYYSFPMFFIDSANVVICKNRYSANSFMQYNIYTDEISEYNKVLYPPDGENMNEIWNLTFISDSIAIGVGGQQDSINNNNDELIWKSTDKGKNWEIIYRDRQEPSFGLQEVTFSDSLNGMAFGAGGKVLLTSDGGETWEYHNGPRQYWLSEFWSSTMCGEYPIIWGQACGIYRYEEYSGVNENILEEIEVKPYQSSTDFFIEINDPKHRQYDLTIASIDGKIILEENINTVSQSISTPLNLLNLNSGAYVYIVNCGDILVSTGKIVNVR
jgi:hypothetical protein